MTIIDQFDLKAAKFNFSRDYFESVDLLNKAPITNFPDHFITNVAGTLYQLTKANGVWDDSKKTWTVSPWKKLEFGDKNALTTDSSDKLQKNGSDITNLVLGDSFNSVEINSQTGVTINSASGKGTTITLGEGGLKINSVDASNTKVWTTDGNFTDISGIASSDAVAAIQAKLAGINDTVKGYVDSQVEGLAQALVFKGRIPEDGLPENPKVGDTYVVGTIGEYAGETCEVGDTIICTVAKSGEAAAQWLVVHKNIDGAVTLEKLESSIQSLITNISKNASFAGIATPTTNPGTPDGPVFYIAKGKGTYTNFGGIDVTEDEVVILYYDTIWHKNATGIASNDKLTELESDVDNLNLEVEIAGVSITKYDFSNLQNGNYEITSARIDPVLHQSDYYRSILFHVNKGDDVVVSTYGGSGGVRAWGLASENYTLIDRSEENLDCRDDKRITLHISEDGYCAVNLNTLQDNGEHFYVKHIHISDNKITREIKNDVENITTDLTSLQVDVNNLEEIIEGKGEKQYVYEDLNQSGYYRIMSVGSSPINPVIVQNEYIKGIYFPVKSGDSVVVSSYSNIENGQNCYGITDLSFNTIERASEKDYLGDKAKTLSITQDGYVFVNFFDYQQDTSKFFIKHKYRSDGIIDKVEVVDFLAKVGTEDAEYSIIDGKYIKSQSRFLEYTDNDSFHCSSPIKLNCGDTIIVESNGANQSIIAQLAECNYSGAPIRSIKNYTKAGVENVEYTAKYSCYVVASWYSLNSIKIKKIISGKLKDFSDALSDVDTYKNNVSRLVDFTENPIAKIRREAGFTSIIRNWGFIGDSLSSGVMNYTTPAPAGTVHMYDLSWCQMLCRLTGATGYNFSYGGQYAKRWVTGKNENGTPNQPERCWEGAKQNPKDGYIIALGENDKDPAQQAIYGCGNVATDVGTYNPETDTDTNANSYAGWMAGIIQRIKSIQPKAPIFIINLPKNPVGTTREEYNKVISDLCDKFNGVYLIDLYKYAPDFYYEPNFYNTYFHPSHPTALGYQWIAWTICTYIDWIIRNNMNDFANQQFVGTQYWHDQ